MWWLYKVFGHLLPSEQNITSNTEQQYSFVGTKKSLSHYNPDKTATLVTPQPDARPSTLQITTDVLQWQHCSLWLIDFLPISAEMPINETHSLVCQAANGSTSALIFASVTSTSRTVLCLQILLFCNIYSLQLDELCLCQCWRYLDQLCALCGAAPRMITG